MEAAINRVPSFAISIAHRGTGFDYEPAGRLARQLAELVLSKGLPEDALLNVNVPLDWHGEVRFTRQSKKVTRNALQEGTDPRGRTYYWLSEQRVTEDLAPESDYAAILDGAASITPLELDRTHAVSLNHLSHWAKLLERRREG
jgi:5'/3'-nucleotidase